MLMVFDYRALDKINLPDSNPFPRIDEAVDQVVGATIFSQTNLIGAYHHKRIRKEETPKTAIRTRFGSFEWRVLPLGKPTHLQRSPDCYLSSFTNLTESA